MNRQPEPLRPALLITGGSGFVGRAIIRELLSPDPVINASEIRIFDLHEPVGFPADPRIRFIPGDIRDAGALKAAAAGADALIHLAALVDWGTHPVSTVIEVNVEGTRNALAAAESEGIKAFVYTSSLDSVITGEPLRDVDESLSYPAKYPNAYCESKAEAEKIVAAADTAPTVLRTVSLRPASVWGEGDPYHISALVNLAIKGPYVRIGDGSAVQQLVYVGNLAHGHLLAARELLEAADQAREPECAGKAYFLTDAPPENFFVFFDSIVEGSGYELRPADLWIPRWLMMGLGIFSEAIALLIRPIVHWNPQISRFAVKYTCNDFTFDSSRASADFGFRPRYGKSEAFDATCEWFRVHGPAQVPVIGTPIKAV